MNKPGRQSEVLVLAVVFFQMSFCDIGYSKPVIPGFETLIRTQPSTTGVGLQIIAIAKGNGLNAKLQVGDWITGATLDDQQHQIAAPKGLGVVSSALAAGRSVLLTVWRAKRQPDSNGGYQRLQIQISPSDLAPLWNQVFPTPVPSVSSSWSAGQGLGPGGYFNNSNANESGSGRFGSSSGSNSPGSSSGFGGGAYSRIGNGYYRRSTSDGAPYLASALPSFPWPPPKFSAKTAIDRALLEKSTGDTTLGDVDRRLRSAFDANDYEIGYFKAPGGYALVTRMESIENDGSPKTDGRWLIARQPIKKFSLSAYLGALFGADPGKYRVIVFAVTTASVVGSNQQPTSNDAESWFLQGEDILPNEVAKQEFSRRHRCVALIYEFARPSKESDPRQVAPGMTAKVHLTKSGLLGALRP